MHIYIPCCKKNIDLPPNHVQISKKWVANILSTAEKQLESISPVLFFTFLVLLNDVSGRILMEVFDDDGIQDMQRAADAVVRTAKKRQELTKAAEAPKQPTKSTIAKTPTMQKLSRDGGASSTNAAQP